MLELSFYHFSFGHCVVCPLIYRFWLPLWYLQTFLSFFFCADVIYMCYNELMAFEDIFAITYLLNFD